MSTSTRDVRPHRILVEAYNKRSYGDDTTTDNEFNPLTSPEDNQLVIKEGGTKNTMTILVKPTVETYGDYQALAPHCQPTCRKSRLSRSSRRGSTSRKWGQ
jgi:hypothetical protein